MLSRVNVFNFTWTEQLDLGSDFPYQGIALEFYIGVLFKGWLGPEQGISTADLRI